MKDKSLSLAILLKGVWYHLAMGITTSKYLVGPRGRKEAVVLEISEYRRMVRKIEDLEDALALDRAEQTSTKLIPYSSVRKRLKRAGKL